MEETLGITPGNEVPPLHRPYSLFNTTMPRFSWGKSEIKGKEKLMAVTATRTRIWPLHFRMARSNSRSNFSEGYALIQVFCFCSTNLTWFNNIIKYKTLAQTNAFGLTRHFLYIYITKLFIAKKVATIHIFYTILTENKILWGRANLTLNFS